MQSSRPCGIADLANSTLEPNPSYIDIAARLRVAGQVGVISEASR